MTKKQIGFLNLMDTLLDGLDDAYLNDNKDHEIKMLVAMYELVKNRIMEIKSEKVQKK